MDFTETEEICKDLGIVFFVDKVSFKKEERSEVIVHQVIDWCYKKKAPFIIQ